MKFKLYRKYGALNSKEVFDAFEIGLKNCGHEVVDDNEEVVVIWSVLWSSKMRYNKDIYYQNINKKPIIILEVGSLVRNSTWKIMLNNINNTGYFGDNFDQNRPYNLNLSIKSSPIKHPHILIALQNTNSLLWGDKNVVDYINTTITELKPYTDRKILVRPHPRSKVILPDKFNIQEPSQIANTYDSYDLDFSYHCVVNYNSGVGTQCGLSGTKLICDSSSLAFDISSKPCDIEKLVKVDYDAWLVKIAHTEWTLNELKSGYPIQRLLYMD